MSARGALAAAAAVALGLTLLPAQAAAEPSTRTVTYRGYAVDVPASWRVVDLDRSPGTCVRTDVSTVYLGRAGDQGSCPARAVGGAPSLWVAPLDETSAARAATRDAVVRDTGAAADVRPDGNGETTVVVRSAGVLVSTYGGTAAADLLDGAGLTTAARPASDGLVAAARQPATASSTSASTSGTPAAHVVPGRFTGRGFDTCSAPGGATVHAWKESTDFRSIGIYIGGVSRACAQPNLSADWVGDRVRGGWHLLPIQVGLQAPCTGFAHRMSSNASTARDQGRGAAKAAVANAKRLGIGARSLLYFDIEAYNSGNATCRRAVLSFLSGWTNKLHALDYRAGVYSSISSGIDDLSDTYNSTSYARPNQIWAAWWNGERNVDFKPYVPDGQWDDRQRVHQYRGGHNETHGGRTLNIDSNYLRVH